jgi:hypothetical protein
MCCPLILYREETKRGVEGPNKMPRSTKRKIKGWHDKRIRKKECDIGDKMLMNSSSNESFKQEEKTTTSHLCTLHHIVSSRSTDEGNILR